MSAVKALRLAQENGIRVDIAGADLILDAEEEPTPVVLDALKRNKAAIVVLLGAANDGWSADDWRALFDERAGITEFDGGQSRGDAEAQAFDFCVIEWLNRNPIQSDPGHCAACGKPNRQGHAVVPFGTDSHGHTWLHPECWQGWHAARNAGAVAALAAVGIKKLAKFPNDFGKNGGE